ncbi:MAG: hypothetical protein NC347_14620 [Clostridium sp.]|nr:hypothetical protein [Clostridium sp.]
MLQNEINFLLSIYNHYKETGDRKCVFRDYNSKEKPSLYNLLNNLKDEGFIEYTSTTIGTLTFKITPAGINYVENGCNKSESPSVVQGANSIFVNGSGNTISKNYNQISVDIEQSDLPDNCKLLIESFLQEMKSPNLSPEEKTGKIQSFLTDISSGTISGVASSGLTALLSSFFSQMMF